MKKIFILFLMTMFMGMGCDRDEYEAVNKYYKLADFDKIIIGESTIDDVYMIAPIEVVRVTSYGLLGEYPTDDGKLIQIRFIGKENVVGSIDVIESDKHLY